MTDRMWSFILQLYYRHDREQDGYNNSFNSRLDYRHGMVSIYGSISTAKTVIKTKES